MWGSKRKGQFTIDYCQDSCATVCAECPRPRLLAAARPAVAGYHACSTQWAYSPRGGRTGLRYGDCLPMLERVRGRLLEESGVDVDMDDLVDGLQAIERGFISADVERLAAMAEAR